MEFSNNFCLYSFRDVEEKTSLFNLNYPKNVQDAIKKETRLQSIFTRIGISKGLQKQTLKYKKFTERPPQKRSIKSDIKLNY